MSVAHLSRLAVLGQPLGMACEQGCHFGLDGSRQQRSRTVAQNLGQRIGKKLLAGTVGKTLVSVTAYHSFGGEVEA